MEERLGIAPPCSQDSCERYDALYIPAYHTQDVRGSTDDGQSKDVSLYHFSKCAHTSGIKFRALRNRAEIERMGPEGEQSDAKKSIFF